MKNKIILPDHLYFVSSKLAIYEYLFNIDLYRDIIINSLKYLIERKYLVLYSFCIMPNHVHYLININKNKTLNEINAKFDSFTSHEILTKARQCKHINLLKSFMKAAENDSDRNNRIWQDVVVRHVTDDDTLYNFLEYIHNNPVNKGWNLVKDRADYRYSSACFYDKDEKPVIKIEDVRRIMV